MVLAPILAGPYWVIAYDEKEGYALVSGGPPTIEGKDGKCQTGKGVNDAGLWIFTREQKRDDALLEKVRGLAEAKGFDLSVGRAGRRGPHKLRTGHECP